MLTDRCSLFLFISPIIYSSGTSGTVSCLTLSQRVTQPVPPQVSCWYSQYISLYYSSTYPCTITRVPAGTATLGLEARVYWVRVILIKRR